MRTITKLIAILALLVPTAFASLANVYVAQSSAGSNTGVDCADAFAATFFNTVGNWGAGGAQIGSDTVVHVCGTWTGGNGVNLLQFQGSGTSGHPVTILFETGAAMKPNYCAQTGCIDLNGQSYLLIDGGTTCGETSHWTTTSCNGSIINQTAGSSTVTCPSGSACSAALAYPTSSTAIGNSTGNPTNVEVRNLHVHMYSRSASDLTDNGMGTSALGMGNSTLAQNLTMHNMMIDGVGKAYVISLGTSASVTLSGYNVYNTNFQDQCWAMGVGANAVSTMNVAGLTFHDNEVSNWDNWAPANPGGGNQVCHGNGTMWYNGDTVHSSSGSFGYIGDSASGQYNNYLHGSLSGNTSGKISSPSGYLSCQDNCININVFNNIVVDTTTGPDDGGGAVYFNGPGGGGQFVANNTMVRPCCAMVVVTGQTNPAIVKNNIASWSGNGGDFVEIRPNCPTCATSDYNDVYNYAAGEFMGYNAVGSTTFLSLATWQGTYSQDTHTITTNPNLTASYSLNAGSPAIHDGSTKFLNLTSAGIAALDSDVAGTSRPNSSFAWDAGAYQFSPPTPALISVGVFAFNFMDMARGQQ